MSEKMDMMDMMFDSSMARGERLERLERLPDEFLDLDSSYRPQKPASLFDKLKSAFTPSPSSSSSSSSASLSRPSAARLEHKEERKGERKEEAMMGGGGGGEEDEEGTPLFTSHVFATLVAKSLFSDVTLVVGKGKERIPAHRIVLAASSPVFATMLYPSAEFPDQKITSPFEVSLPSVDPSTFRQLLACIYSDDLKVDPSNLPALITLGRRYQVDKLGVLASEFMTSDVSLENACELFEMAPSLLGDAEFGLPFIREHTEDILDTDGFLKLSAGRLRALLSDDELSADEFLIYQALMKWGGAQVRAMGSGSTEGKSGGTPRPDEVKAMVSDLIPSIRFPLMPLDQIAGVIAPSGVLVQEHLLELFKFVSLSDEKEKESAAARLPFSWKPRAGGAGSLGIDKISNILTKKLFSDKKLVAAFSRFFVPPTSAARPSVRPKAKFSLIYRGSRDGFNASSFHSRCDGKGSTFTVIKVSGRAHIFGGYHEGSITGGTNAWSTSGAWIYSLVNNQSKPVRLENTGATTNMFYSGTSYGPTWGTGHDLHVNSSMQSGSNHCNPTLYRTVTTGFPSVGVDNTLLAGAQNWSIEEIEVFSVTGYAYNRYGM